MESKAAKGKPELPGYISGILPKRNAGKILEGLHLISRPFDSWSGVSIYLSDYSYGSLKAVVALHPCT